MVANNLNENIVNPHNHPYLTFIYDNFSIMKERMYQELGRPIEFVKIHKCLASSWKIHKLQQIPIEEAMDISFDNWFVEMNQN